MNDQSLDEQGELKALDAKIKALLPPHYEDCYTDIEPVSMGSAALKLGPDGQVAWDEIWTSFCHLALAGGPPHRGKWLAAASAEEARANKKGYDAVVKEIARGIWLTTSLPVLPHVAPGWVAIRTSSGAMAAWLTRAIVAENVCARQHGDFVHLPAGPDFRLEKEVKNVITAVAKTCHYWTCHIPEDQSTQPASAKDFLTFAIAEEIRSWPDEYHAAVQEIALGATRNTGLPSVPSHYPGWVGVECSGAEMAVWLMRALAVENMMVRREDSILFLPVAPQFAADNKAQRVVAALVNAHRLWKVAQRPRAGASG